MRTPLKHSKYLVEYTEDVILDSQYAFIKQKVTVRSDLDPGEVQDLGRDRSWVLALARLAQVPGDTFSCNQ